MSMTDICNPRILSSPDWQQVQKLVHIKCEIQTTNPISARQEPWVALLKSRQAPGLWRQQLVLEKLGALFTRQKRPDRLLCSFLLVPNQSVPIVCQSQWPLLAISLSFSTTEGYKTWADIVHELWIFLVQAPESLRVQAFHPLHYCEKIVEF